MSRWMDGGVPTKKKKNDAPLRSSRGKRGGCLQPPGLGLAEICPTGARTPKKRPVGNQAACRVCWGCGPAKSPNFRGFPFKASLPKHTKRSNSDEKDAAKEVLI